ncbi:MAG TPA: LysM peptidoglycan-binding domain-containing protein [Gemmataceae bacterium]|nr:LysM peptidoglycan-binding domain-containing protein [Gemmataceae bacterium]
MADPQTDMINRARTQGAGRVLTAVMVTTGTGSLLPLPASITSAIMIATAVSPQEAGKIFAQQTAIRIFNEEDPDMDVVADVLRKMRNRLMDLNLPIELSPASDPLCDFEAYVVGNRSPIHICPRFFNAGEEQRIRTMIHEAAHLVGIGTPGGEAYYPFYDGQPFGGGFGPNEADSWGHYVHVVSGQPLDKPDGGPGHAATPPPETSDTSYTVVPGDYLSKIAQHFYGDANQWRKIYDANRDVIGPNPDKIYPGQVLTIPDAEG